ncbi:MAG: septum formation initiator family protein [Streptococcaceae bacterium]|jgi:cell division protein DivIC|nr:septum formation initiator family protein [Streptococcaceae bacterium]
MENNENQQKPRVMRLNNDFTNQKMKEQSQNVAPRRRYLGLILIAVIAVLTLPAYGLLSSFQGLEKARATNAKTTLQSSQQQYAASSQSELIKNMQNPYYIQKYARSEYSYILPGEKLFMAPSSSSSAPSTSDQ